MIKKLNFLIYHLIFIIMLIGFLWHENRLSKLEYKSGDFTNGFIFLRDTEELARLNFFTAKHNFYLTTALNMDLTDLTEEQKASVLNKKWNVFLESLPDITKDDRTYIAGKAIRKDMIIHREAKQINESLNLIKSNPDVFPNSYKFIFQGEINKKTKK